MELRLVIILTLAFIILYWYYQKNSDANESYLLPFKISKKWNSQNQKNINEGAFSVRSTLFCEKRIIEDRYTIGCENNIKINNEKWEKKIKNSLSGIGAPKLIKGKLKEELKECKYFSIGAKRDIDKIFYKVHYWKDLDNNNSKNTVKNKEDIIEDLNNDSEIDGVRYEWNPDDLSSVSVRKYFCDKNVNGESINKHIIKYSTYDMSLYNSITNMVSDLLSSPLREEVSIPVILTCKGNDGYDSVCFRLNDYNAKLKQVSSFLLEITDYLKIKKKQVERWLDKNGNNMLSGFSFGFDKNKKFFLNIHFYTMG